MTAIAYAIVVATGIASAALLYLNGHDWACLAFIAFAWLLAPARSGGKL